MFLTCRLAWRVSPCFRDGFFFHTCQGFDGKYFITSLAFFSHSIVVDDDEQSLCAFI